MRCINGEKILVIEEKRTERDDGQVLIENLYQDGYTEKYLYTPYWHPYELRYPFRDYKAYSRDSYIRLGRKIKKLGLCNEKDSESWYIDKVLDQIAKLIPMNLRLYALQTVDAEPDKRTLKQIYQTREKLREAMNSWVN
tara:strand:- start:743 stop:1159 length:417 start_codon:yes stop_codon:yes gene_type:complete